MSQFERAAKLRARLIFIPIGLMVVFAFLGRCVTAQRKAQVEAAKQEQLKPSE